MNKFEFENLVAVIGNSHHVVVKFKNGTEYGVMRATGDVAWVMGTDEDDMIDYSVSVSINSVTIEHVPTSTVVTWEWSTATAHVTDNGVTVTRRITFDYQRTILAVVAMAENGAIGNKGKLPWHIPNDLKWFKYITTRHTAKLVMGRKTWESVSGYLPDREIIVLTRNVAEFEAAHPDVRAYSSRVDLLKAELGDLIICGGAEIYELFKDDYHLTYVTMVDYTGEYDTVINPWFYGECGWWFTLPTNVAGRPKAEVKLIWQTMSTGHTKWEVDKEEFLATLK